MEGKQLYTQEYVQIIGKLAGMEANMKNVEAYVREIQRHTAQMEVLVQKNRAELAAVKATASLLGGAAGFGLSVVARLLGFGS
jgi:hypothetical protein